MRRIMKMALAVLAVSSVLALGANEARAAHGRHHGGYGGGYGRGYGGYRGYGGGYGRGGHHPPVRHYPHHRGGYYGSGYGGYGGYGGFVPVPVPVPYPLGVGPRVGISLGLPW